MRSLLYHSFRILAFLGGSRRLGLSLLGFLLVVSILGSPAGQPSTPLFPASASGKVYAQAPDPTPSPTLDPVSEILANRSQTDGIIIGAIILMLIILLATVGSLKPRPSPPASRNPPPGES